MDLTTFTNQYIFPVLLLIFFLITFNQPNKIDRTTINNYSSTTIKDNTSASSQLEQFYELVEQDESLIAQIETIITQDNFVTEIIALGNSLGYQLTASDIEKSTSYINDKYICLPIGCWNKP